jgi:hypothetical protein
MLTYEQPTNLTIEEEEKQMGCGPKKGKRRVKVRRERSERDSLTSSGGTSTILMPRVPEKCSNCGAVIHTKRVNWTGPNSVECSYCGSVLSVEFERIV